MLKFPKNIHLQITHNIHNIFYQSIEDYIRNDLQVEWVPGDARERAIATDSMWVVSWYPDTLVGFCSMAGATLEEVLDYIYEN